MSSAPSNLTCEICFDYYDAEIRIPKSLSCCGKTVCRRCLEVILRDHRLQCPWCKTKISADSHTYKTNLQLLSVIQEDSKWEKCPHHEENMKLVCLQDKRKVCPYCGYTSECKDHKLVHLLELKPASDERLGELKDHLSRANKKTEQYEKVINKNWTIFQDLICDQFDKQIYELQKAKAKTLMKVNSVLSKKQVEVSNAFGPSSSLRAEVQKKISNHMNFLKAEDPVSLMEEDLTMLKSRVESLVGRGQDVVDFDEQLAKMAPLVQQRLENMFPVPDLSEVIDERIADTPGVEAELGEIEELNLQVRELWVDFCPMENRKIVLAFQFENDRGLKSIKLDAKKVKETEAVSIDLEGIDWNEWNLKALECVLALQGKTSEVFLTVRASSIAQKLEQMTRLFSVLFKKPQDITDLTAFLPPVNDIVMLVNTVLPRLSSLKKLRINSVAFDISRQNLNDLANNLLLLGPNLESLYLNLSGSNFPVKKLSFSLPKIQRFNLNVRKIAPFDDTLLSEIIENLPVSMPNVQDFHIDVSKTSVTHACVTSIREKIIHIPTSSIGFIIPADQPRRLAPEDPVAISRRLQQINAPGNARRHRLPRGDDYYFAPNGRNGNIYEYF